MRSWSKLIVALGSMVVGLPALAADLPVDLQLMLAVDVSGSMDLDEQRLQREGYLDALAHPDVIDGILSGPEQRIAIAYMEWAGPGSEAVVVPWQLIDGREAAARFADQLAEAPLGRTRYTSISTALRFAARQFDGNGFVSDRKVIDISGDGPNNSGKPVVPARDEAAARGIVVNGLPIMIKSSPLPTVTGYDLDTYYEDCVITGPDAFVVPVRTIDDFAKAIRKKMALEIAWNPPRAVPAAAENAPSRVNCGIGEKMRGIWFKEPQPAK